MLKTLIYIKISGTLNVMLSGGVKNANKASNLKKVGFAALYLFVIGIFVALCSLYAVILVPLADLGLSWLYFALFLLVAFSLVFFMSIFETKSELFESKDNDLLLSMPIRPRDIVNMRISVVLIYNYVETAVVMVPTVIVYAMYTGDIMGIIGGVISSLAIPLLATSLAAGVGALVAAISRKMKNKTLSTVILSLIFVISYIMLYSAMTEGMDNFIEDLGANAGALASTMSPVKFLGDAALLAPLEIIVLLAVCVGVSSLCYFIISKNYVKIVTDRKSQSKKAYKKTVSKKNTALISLTKKELGRFFSSATYILNGAMGLIFMVLIAVLALFGTGEINMLINSFFEDPMINSVMSSLLAPIFIGAIIFFASLCTISSSALSLEGKNLWIIKSMPVKSYEVLLAKTLPHTIICAIPTLLTSIALGIVGKAGPFEMVFYILTPQVANIFNAFFGMFINTAFPKFDYENEAQPIKQSLATFVTMMGQMVIGVGIMSLSILMAFLGLQTVAIIVQLLILIALSTVFAILLLIPMAKRFEKL